MPKLLLFYPIFPSFVRSDYGLLQSAFDVRKFHFNATRKILTPFYFVSQLIFLLIQLSSSRLFVSHFSGYHSFLPALIGKLFDKPHFIILNGTECHNFPEYQYGYLRKPLLFWFSKKSLQWSTLLLPVSETLISSTYTYAPTKFVSQGFRHFYKHLNTPHEVVYNGVDIDLFPLEKNTNRPLRSFISIASGIESASRRGIKGLDLVIELARRTPENEFTLVGAGHVHEIELPSNVKLIGFVPHEQLNQFYNQHTFYLQLSASEGFGLALCEAMLCGCIPIVSQVGILPSIAGETGYVLKTKSVEALQLIVEQAIYEYDHSNINKARKHIIDTYPLYKRKEHLFRILANYSS